MIQDPPPRSLGCGPGGGENILTGGAGNGIGGEGSVWKLGIILQ